MSATAWEELCAMIKESGAVMTFDSRRYARAAHGWPDRLPPMFGEASVAVERWGKHSKWDQWVSQHPSEWPEPTVYIGQVYEQKSSLIESWEAAALYTGDLKIIRHRVVAIHGERFLNERGRHIPWAEVHGPHYRLVSPLIPGAWSCGPPITSSVRGAMLHARRFTSVVTGLCAAEAWRPVEVLDEYDTEWTWHTWDVDGIGGENAGSPSYDEMVKDVTEALDRQAKRSPVKWHMVPVEPDEEDEDEG